MLVAVILALFFGSGVVRSIEGCATAALVNETKGYVMNLTTAFAPLLANSSLNETQKQSIVLQRVCDNASDRDLVNKIEAKVHSCPEVAIAANLGSLAIGSLNFSDLFTSYTSVSQFCACRQAMMQTVGLTQMKMGILNMDPTLKYKLINTSMLCMSSTVQQMVMGIYANLSTCETVLKYSNGFLNRMNVKLMHDFHHTQCMNNYDAAKFECAVAASKITMYKNCIDQSQTPCQRNACVDKYIEQTSCGNAHIWYMWSVNMAGGDIFELMADKCNDATSAVFSLSLLIVAVLSWYGLV